MEGIADLCLNIGDTIGSADDLYYSLDTDSTENTSRPSSVMSWTFSPIPDDGSIVNNHDFSLVIPDQPTCDTIKVEPPKSNIIKTSPTSDNRHSLHDNNQHPVPVEMTYKQINNQMNNFSEYIYPNNITYHHSVNIHNYVGNYCTPSWWGNQPCTMVQPIYDKYPAEYVQMIEQTNDPLMNLTSSNVDFMRCPTPDYLVALNSLNQLDSPPRPNHSAALKFPCVENNPLFNGHSPQQDSGYNSDLNVSPVIKYQDHIKLRRHTSTPNPQPGLLKSSVKVSTSQPTAKSHSTRLLLPTYKPKVPMCPENMKPEEIKAQIYRALHQKIPTSKQLVSTSTMAQHCDTDNQTTNTIKSMADFHAAKKSETKTQQPSAPVKRKATLDQHLSNHTEKKRRANEPLNQKAIDVMNNWYLKNSENPYPTKGEKEQLAREGGITLAQVKSWFANKRNRSNNTRPKKQKLEMEGRLMEICHQLARDAAKPNKDNAYYIQQLSSIIRS